MACGQEPFYTGTVVFDAEGKVSITVSDDGDMVFTDASEQMDGNSIRLYELAGVATLCSDILECVESGEDVIKSIIDCDYIQSCMDNQSIVVFIEDTDWDSVVVGDQTMYEVKIPHGLIIDGEPGTLSTQTFSNSYDIISVDTINVNADSGESIYVRSTRAIDCYLSVEKI